MAIGKDKTRTMLSLEYELKTTLEALAEQDNRSLNNYIVTILKEHVNNELLEELTTIQITKEDIEEYNKSKNKGKDK